MRAQSGSAAVLGGALLAVLVAAGCSTEKPDPTIADAAALPVTCNTVPVCTAKWKLARQWLEAHTKRKIVESSGVIETAADPADRSPSFKVVLAGHGTGSAEIQLVVECRGGCQPSEQELRGEFNLFLSRGDSAR